MSINHRRQRIAQRIDIKHADAETLAACDPATLRQMAKVCGAAFERDAAPEEIAAAIVAQRDAGAVQFDPANLVGFEL